MNIHADQISRDSGESQRQKLVGRPPQLQRSAGNSGTAGSILALQRNAGNAATAQVVGQRGGVPTVQRDDPPGSPAAEVGAVVGAPVSNQDISATVNLAAGTTLSNAGDTWVHTTGPVTITARVTSGGISINFSPSLTITKRNAILGMIDADIDVDEFGLDFQHQISRTSWTAANAVNWFGDPGGQLLAAFGGAISQLPARTSVPGYDPFADPDIVADLQSLIARLGSGAGSTPPAAASVQIETGFTLSSELSRDLGHGVSMVVPAGTHFEAIADLAGGIPHDAASIRISMLRLRASAGVPNINLRALGQDWPVVSLAEVDVASGGSVTANYTIIHEEIGTALLNLLAVAVVEANPLAAGSIRDDLTVHDQAAHRLVDQMIHDSVNPVLHDAILQNRAAIPGLDLAAVLGVQ